MSLKFNFLNTFSVSLINHRIPQINIRPSRVRSQNDIVIDLLCRYRKPFRQLRRIINSIHAASVFINHALSVEKTRYFRTKFLLSRKAHFFICFGEHRYAHYFALAPIIRKKLPKAAAIMRLLLICSDKLHTDRFSFIISKHYF